MGETQAGVTDGSARSVRRSCMDVPEGTSSCCSRVPVQMGTPRGTDGDRGLGVSLKNLRQKEVSWKSQY